MTYMDAETQLLENCYERFCTGEISREELLKEMELLSIITLSNYLLTELREKQHGNIPERNQTT